MTIMMGKEGQQPPLPQVAIVPPSDDPPLLSPPWSQMAATRLSRPTIPLPIPNIIVEPVPARDAFGHSRTPPFVPSPSQWGPPQFSSSLSRKARAHSDSYLARKDSSPYPQPPASAIGLPMKTEQSIFSFDFPPKTSLTVPGMEGYSCGSSVPMETDRPLTSTEKAEEDKTDCSKPHVPFSWHFQSKEGHEKSPKMYWLRRHSDSNLPRDNPTSLPEDSGLSVGSHQDLRGKSEGDTPLPSPLFPSRDSPEADPLLSPKSPKHEGVVSNRLKLKKYLQKRYIMGLKRVRQSSADADDVFSDRGPDTPSPGIIKAVQHFAFDSEKEETPSPTEQAAQAVVRPLEPALGQPSKETSRQTQRKPPPAIKTEPISSCDSDQETDGAPYPSPLLPPPVLKAHSLDSPHWSGGRGIFHFMSSPGGSAGSKEAEDVSTARVSSQDSLPPFSSMMHASSMASRTFPQYATSFTQGSPSWPMPTSPLASNPTTPKTEGSKVIYCPFNEKVEEQRHQRDPTFMCPVCGQVFPSYNYLANHMVNHLPSEVVSKGPGDSNKIHLCKVCNRAFSRSDMLTRHMRLHTGLRPYECRVCGQVFSRSDHLHTHLRTHTGEKPYRCPQCPYAAPRRDMITRHMRIHMKQQRTSRGRRSSSVSSAASESEMSSADVKRRNQSLSSVESQDSTESLFRRSSTASEATENLWSSAESGGHDRLWSATSVDSAESYPSPHAVSPRGGRLHFSFHGEAEGPTQPLWGGSIQESLEQPQVSPEGTGDSSLDIQTSFQKCKVTSDRDSSCSSSSDAAMSPSAHRRPQDS